jgi:hypothetical protein
MPARHPTILLEIILNAAPRSLSAPKLTLLTGTGIGSDGALAARADFTMSSGLLSVTIANTLAASQIHSAGHASMGGIRKIE